MKQLHIAGALALTLATTLAACKNEKINTTAYQTTILVSNRAAIPAGHQDAHLINPWGLAFGPAFAWVANNGTQTSTLYDGNGVPQTLVVTLPNGVNGTARPTGLVYNGSTTDFMVTANAVTGPAQFIYSGEGGTISGWSSAPGFGNNTAVVYDDGIGTAIYKGLALLNVSGHLFLYASDFHHNKIDTFDNAFHKVATAGGFVDPTLPAGYAPFGIQAVNGNLIVTYAKQLAPTNEDEVVGPGLGYVDEFDGTGHFLKRLVSGGALNAPWGIALAPADFGPLANTLLIGNFGDGRINAYNATTGDFVDTMKKPNGDPVEIDGLWAIVFGNGNYNQPTNTLFFTAGVNGEVDGVYGRIDTTTFSN